MTGAFDKNDFGYGARSSAGKKSVGHELDVVLGWQPTRWLELSAGYSHIWGSSVYERIFPDDPDVKFGFAQVLIEY